MAIRKRTVSYGETSIQKEFSFNPFWIASSGGTVFLDETADAADGPTGTADVTFTGAVNDAIYCGYSEAFAGLEINMTTGASTAGGATRVFEYWNGATWAPLSLTVITGNINLTSDSAFRWQPPTDWATTTVNAVSAYYIRIRVSVAFATPGAASIIVGAPYVQLFNAKTIQMAETSKTILSAYLRIWHKSTPSSGNGFSYVKVDMREGVNPITEVYLNLGTLATTGETNVFFQEIDVTSFMTTYFTGTSHNIDVWASVLNRSANSLGNNYSDYSCELFITYEYDDVVNTNQTCTLAIPIQSFNGNITASLSLLGQIPQLTGVGGFIEQDFGSLYDMYITFRGNSRENSATSCNFQTSIDAESATNLSFFNTINASDNYTHIIWRRTDLSLGSSHSINVASTPNSVLFSNIYAVVFVTFSYNHSTSTRLTETRIFNAFEDAGYAPGTTLGQKATREFVIPESNPVLKQSGVEVFYSLTGSGTKTIEIFNGAQSPTNYSVTNGTGSGYAFLHRFDPAASAGDGLDTFGSGLNTLETNYRLTSSVITNVTSLSGHTYLNYSYDKHSSFKSESYRVLLFPDFNGTALSRVAAFSLNIPHTNYYINGLAAYGKYTLSGTVSSMMLTILKGAGDWQTESIQIIRQTNELIQNLFSSRIRAAFKRHPQDPDSSRVDVEVPHDFYYSFTSTNSFSSLAIDVWTYDYNFDVTGTITGYTGNGSGIEIKVFRADTDELLYETTTAIGGTYTVTAYYDVEGYVTARQGTTAGRTENKLLSDDLFDIDFSGGGPVAVQRSYGYFA